VSQALVGGLVGAVGASFVVKRVKEVKMYYADAGSGEHEVLVAVCVDSSCTIDHTDVDGTVHSNVSLNQYDMVLGGKVAVKSGRMFIMSAVQVGAL
jgi:hypothetical protein